MSRQRSPTSIFIGLVILALAFWKLLPLFSKSDVAITVQPEPVTTTQTPLAAASLPQARSRALYTTPRSASVEAIPPEITPACASFWEKLRALDLEKNFTFPPDPEKSVPTAAECSKVPTDLAAAHQMFIEACQPMATLTATQQQQWQAAVGGCQFAALLYRAKITEWLTRDLPLNAIADNKTLADKLMARFADNPAGAADVAERLLERDPDMVIAAKASALGRFMDAQGSATGKEADSKWTKAMDSISRLERSKGSDPAQQLEIRILTTQRRTSDPHAFRDEAIKAAESNPGIWVGPYYAAWGENLLGNGAEAQKWLNDCLLKLPGDGRCQKARENLAKGEAYPFQSHLTLSLNPLIE